MCDRFNIDLDPANPGNAVVRGDTFGPFTLYLDYPCTRVLCQVRASSGSAVVLTLCDGPTVPALDPATGAACYAAVLTAPVPTTAPTGLFQFDVKTFEADGTATTVMAGPLSVSGDTSRGS